MFGQVTPHLVVMASLERGAINFRNVVIALATAVIIGGLAFRHMRGEHRENASGFPTVMLILILGSAAGIIALRTFGLAFVKLISGSG